jgi:predicted O-linked N-acetylglucosamine transferase (SPINDLY family)
VNRFFRAARSILGSGAKGVHRAAPLMERASRATAEGRYEDAVESYRQALAVDPATGGAWHGLGEALRKLRKPVDALSAFERALVLEPADASVHARLADTLAELGEFPRAVARYENALALQSDRQDWLVGLGDAHARLGSVERAADCYDRAIRISPVPTGALLALAGLMRDHGRLNEALACYRRILEFAPGNAEAESGLLASENLVEPDPEVVFRRNLAWGRMQARAPAGDFENEADPDRRLRVGYVSGDFRYHVAARFIEPVLESHDFAKFEAVCYDNWSRPDAFTARLQRHADEWRYVADLSDAALAELIRRDRIDILVDLSGHTRLNRLRVFASKPAPVQAAFLGYPATTGLGAMDYRITDRFADPPGLSERYYTETLVRVPDSLWCYKPDSQLAEVSPLPALGTGNLTFGSFNNSTKIGPEAIGLWSEVLRAVPRSRLLLVTIPHGRAREDLERAFESRGIDPGRLEFWPRVTVPEFQRLHHRVDVALDTFPSNGGTTTCESLLMGVPVITLAGRAFVSRAGLSILTNAGIPEFVAQSADEYVAIARRCADDPAELGGLRQLLRHRFLRSPVADAGRYVAGLEGVYRQIWGRWCAGAAAASH